MAYHERDSRRVCPGGSQCGYCREAARAYFRQHVGALLRARVQTCVLGFLTCSRAQEYLKDPSVTNVQCFQQCAQRFLSSVAKLVSDVNLTQAQGEMPSEGEVAEADGNQGAV